MTEKKTKLDDSLLRTPKPKKKLGLKVPTIRMPHEDLIKPEKPLELVKSSTKLNDTTGTTKQAGITNSTSHTSTTGTTTQPTSPDKDFTKTPNSVVKIALAQGIFRGKSKQIYDYLWLVSRGAVNPNRRVRKTFNEIQKGSGLGSRNTVLAGISHLENVGLIIRHVAVGESAGNTYEIFTPEEIGIIFGTTGTTDITGTTGTAGTTQNLVVPVQPENGTTGTIQTTENKEDSAALRHSLKTFKEEDDEPAARLLQLFENSARKVTGKDLSERDYSALEDALNLLIAETEIAAGRTSQVSSYGPFLAENLRRRLHAKPRIEKKGSEPKKDTVGQTYISAPVPLDDEGKLMMLESYKTYLVEFGIEWVDQNEEFFTPEDWQWIKTELAKTDEQE